MVITKVREYLGVGLALVAALSLGYSVITSMRLDATQASLDNALSNNENLIGANDVLYDTVNELVQQREIDDQLLSLLRTEFDVLAENSFIVRERVDEIRESDSEFKELLSKRHPPNLKRVLNSRSTGEGGGNNQDKATQ